MKKVSYRGIPFYLPPPGEKHDSRSVGMSYWFEDNLKTALTYVDHIWFAHSNVNLEEFRIFELFAGMGVSAAYLKSRNISLLVGMDHNAENIEAYKLTHPEAKVTVGDTYTLAHSYLDTKAFNYIMFEHNALTMYRAAREEKERKLLDATFNAEAEYILFVDSARPKEHLHYATYSKFFGGEITDSRSYLKVVSAWVNATYGYAMVNQCSHDSVNYSMLFKRGAAVEDVDMVDTRKVVDLGRYHATV